MKNIIIVIGLSIAVLFIGCSDIDEPAINQNTSLWVVQQYFTEKEFPDKNNYMIGEQLEQYGNEPHLGSMMEEGISHSFLRVDETANTAKYIITFKELNLSRDLYCFLIKEESIWKIQAVRTLVFPPDYYAVLDSLQDNMPLPAEKMWGYNNMKLTTTSDQNLVQYFVVNEKRFQYLLDYLKEMPSDIMFGLDYDITEQAKMDNVGIIDSVKALALTSAGKSGNLEGCYDFHIGGVGQKSIGYFYCEDPMALPDMTPDRFILVLLIKSNWYLYKTI